MKKDDLLRQAIFEKVLTNANLGENINMDLVL
jgi:hypothetical protein